MKNWTVANIPDQSGKRALITGANSGIGYDAALELARKGAHILFASRDPARGEGALARLRMEAPGSSAELLQLDLASLGAIRKFAVQQLERGLPLDLLINNAGVMAPPKRLETAEGFELQFGTNVLGHFALTALLFPLLQKAAGAPRIVTIASIAHKRGEIDFQDLQATQDYQPMRSYPQSKLANLMLAFAMERRLHAMGSPILSVAAHPGVANTNLFKNGDYTAIEQAIRTVFGGLIGLFLNSSAQGALPTLYAATDPEAVGGGYYGPKGFQEMRGRVGLAEVAPQALDEAVQERLWTVCEQLTGIKFL